MVATSRREYPSPARKKTTRGDYWAHPKPTGLRLCLSNPTDLHGRGIQENRKFLKTKQTKPDPLTSLNTV